jgi:GrpB-like predicted nucleotidyltransferase (UPF0157 family)
VRFEREHDRLEQALGELAERVEHIGSTAVPGLAAKPIIDVLVEVADPEADDAIVRPLETAGCELRAREPGHRMLRTRERDVHVHVWRTGDEEITRQLTFRATSAALAPTALLTSA